MSLITPLIGFGLRQVIGDYADGPVQVATAIEQLLPRPLPHPAQCPEPRPPPRLAALGVALAGDGFLDRVKVFFASGDDKGVRQQVQLFLDGNAVSFDGAPADFRRDCLDELQRLRKSGRLSTPEGAHTAIARQAAAFQRHADPQGLVEEARRAVNGVADALTETLPEPGPAAAHAHAGGSAVAGGGLLLFLPPRGRDQRRTGPRPLLRRPTATVGVAGEGVRRGGPSVSVAWRTIRCPFRAIRADRGGRSRKRIPSRSRRMGRCWTYRPSCSGRAARPAS